MTTQVLIEKINKLPIEKVIEVEDFVEFLYQKTVKNQREMRSKKIAEYADKFAQTDVDLDEELENASLELLNEEQQ